MTGMAWPYVAGLSTDVLVGVNLELHRLANPREPRPGTPEKSDQREPQRPSEKGIDPQGSSLIWTARLAVGPFVPAGS